MVIPQVHHGHTGSLAEHHPHHSEPIHDNADGALWSWRSTKSSQGSSRKLKTTLEQIWPFLTLLCVLIWIGVGVYVGMKSEGWSWLTSLYVITQIITTVGYGDILVHTPQMKIFMTFYVLGCLIFLSYVINKYAEMMLSKNSDYFKEKADVLHAKQTNTPRPSSTMLGRLGPMQAALMKLLVASLGFIFWVALGTIFFATYEACSCSYGITKAEGCIDGDRCPETGGYTKSWVDAFYMSVITLTSVGFGDHTPKSWWGRVFGVVWMVFGVITTGSWVGTMADLFFQSSQEDSLDHLTEFTKEVFVQMDQKHKGYVTRDAFLEFLLLKYKLVNTEDLQTIGKLFDDVDTDNSGSIDIEEVDRRFGVPTPGRDAGKAVPLVDKPHT